jgi:hypothetical protein
MGVQRRRSINAKIPTNRKGVLRKKRQKLILCRKKYLEIAKKITRNASLEKNSPLPPKSDLPATYLLEQKVAYSR